MGPLFQVVEYAGAAYLVWLGYKAFRVFGFAAGDRATGRDGD